MWVRYRDGAGLPITIISIIIILFVQGYVRTSVFSIFVVLILGVFIYVWIRESFLTPQEKQEKEELRRRLEREYEQRQEEKEEKYNLHEQWASPVRKKLENDPLWREAVYRTHTHCTHQKLTEDQVQDRVRELLPQLVVDAPEHWPHERIIIAPQIFYHGLDSIHPWYWREHFAGLELWGYAGKMSLADIFGDNGEESDSDEFDTFYNWDCDMPTHPYSLDLAMEQLIAHRFGQHQNSMGFNSEPYMHLYPYFGDHNVRANMDSPTVIHEKETLDRLSSEFPAPTPRHHHERRRTIPRDVQDRVWRRDSGKCAQCGSNKNLEFDHIIPFSKGGANTYRNLQLLCQKCNRSKSDKIGG